VWRAGLVRRLVAALRGTLTQGRPVSAAGRPLDEPGDPGTPDWADALADGEVRLLVEPQPDGTRVRVAAADRIGLLADVSGALTTAGMTVRAAHAAVHGGTAVSTWEVESADVDPARLRLRLDRVLDGSVDLRARLGVPSGAPGGAAGGVRVRLLPDVSGTATVLEVRAGDRAGLVWRLCRALADAGADVRSAHLETLGPQAEDVVYVTDRAGRPLDPERAEQVREAVHAALTGGAGGSDG
jgi:[protein-PII] uridylyltransferase